MLEVITTEVPHVRNHGRLVPLQRRAQRSRQTRASPVSSITYGSVGVGVGADLPCFSYPVMAGRSKIMDGGEAGVVGVGSVAVRHLRGRAAQQHGVLRHRTQPAVC
jgi:hypothetical protein